MAGRPQAEIDWKKVDELLEAGCLTTEVAAYLGIEASTLYRRCEADHNIKYSRYSQEKKAKGESLLRAKQYQVAMEGDKTMLVWLGKQRLDQLDKPKEDTANTTKVVFEVNYTNGTEDKVKILPEKVSNPDPSKSE